MAKNRVYIQLKRKDGKLVADGYEDLFGKYSSEQLETICKKVDGCDVVECPVFETDEHGNVTEFCVPVPS